MISPDQAQALVAKCLVDPIFLAKVVGAGSLAEPPDVTFESVAAQVLGVEECRRLQHFQGFITKVKHNALRRVLPNTFRLLADAGLELRFFVRFAEAYTIARQAGPLPCARHLDLLAPALAAFLSDTAEAEACALTMEMFEHERMLHELPLGAADAAADTRWAWNGNCVVAQRRFDVVALAEELRTGHCSASPRRRRHYLLYQAVAPDATTRIREVDMLTALILSQLLAGRSAPAIAQHVSATIDRVVGADEIGVFVKEAIDAGILASSRARAVADPA